MPDEYIKKADAYRIAVHGTDPDVAYKIQQLKPEKHLNEIESQVPRWIPVTERLPDEGEYVLIWVGNVQVARIEKGISKQERSLMKEGAFPDPIEYGWTSSFRRIGTKRSDCYRACDEDGNNKVPYKWYANGGPMAWFGQDVTHWMPLPNGPDLTGEEKCDNVEVEE